MGLGDWGCCGNEWDWGTGVVVATSGIGGLGLLWQRVGLVDWGCCGNEWDWGTGVVVATSGTGGCLCSLLSHTEVTNAKRTYRLQTLARVYLQAMHCSQAIHPRYYVGFILTLGTV